MNGTETAVQHRDIRGLGGVNIILGLWVLVSPFVLAFGGMQIALWNNVVTGIVIAIIALIGVGNVQAQPGCSWINSLLGIWLIISPFVLGFTQSTAAVWNNVIVGIVIAFVAWTNVGARSRAMR